MAKYQKYSHVIALAGYIICVVALLGVSLFPSDTTLLFGDDIHREHYFWQTTVSSLLGKGIPPWWDPYTFSGTPLAANPQVTPFYPFNWIFLATSHTWSYSVFIAIHLVIAMMGMYWLLRNWTDPVSSWVAGVVYGLSGFFTARIFLGHMGVIAGASYVPLLAGFLWRATRSKNPVWIIGGGCVMALALCAGHPSIVYIGTAWSLGVLAIGASLEHRSVIPFVRLFLIVVVGMGLACVQLLPMAQLMERGIRTFSMPYTWTSQGAHTVNNLLELLAPFIHGDQYTYTGAPPNYGEHAAFIGRLPLVAAILALSAGAYSFLLFVLYRGKVKKSFQTHGVSWRVVLLFAAIATVGLWVSLGSNVPLSLQYLLWRAAPLYKGLRFPSRHLILFVFGASALAGLGVGSLRYTLLRTAVAFLVALELVSFGRHFISVKEVPASRHDPELIRILQRDSQPYRLLPNFGAWVPPRDSLDFNSGALYGIFSVTGYDPTMLRNYYEFVDAVNGATVSSVMQHNIQIPYLNVYSRYVDFLNIKYILVPPAYDPIGTSNDRFILLREDRQRQYRLYESRTVLPRFFFVPALEVLPNREAVAVAIRQGRRDPSEAVYASRNDIGSDVFPADCTQGQKGTVGIVSYAPDRITLSAYTPCNAFLVSSEVWYPGWEAYIDGVKGHLFEGNLAFRTLYVPKGKHTIEMRYNPRIFVLGALISGSTLLGSLLWVLKKRNLRRAYT